MMQRDIEDDLKIWKSATTRMPLILRGPRQVGKSFIIEQFAKQNFDHTAIVNLEQHKDLHACFDTLDPEQICLTLSAFLNVPIIPGKTLLFLDEIQECPRAIQALRYFYEKKPDLHVISAGSLLELVLTDTNFSMPVGRVEYLYLQPMSFEEFLLALKEHEFLAFLNHYQFGDPFPSALHKKGLDLIKQYCVIGGMPAIIKNFIAHQELQLTQGIQDNLLNTYRDDFHKYGNRIDTQLCETIFDKSPNLIARHFKYTDIDPDKQSKQIKPALTALIHAGIYHNIHATTVQGLPINANLLPKKRKLLFIDIGLIKRMLRIDATLLIQNDLHLVNAGQLAEQLIGQALLCVQSKQLKPALFYWQRDAKGSQAEIDYIFQIDDQIVPIEVKAGHAGRLRSMRLFLEQSHNQPHIANIGLKISKDPVSRHNDIVSIPFYLIGQLTRLLRSLLA